MSDPTRAVVLCNSRLSPHDDTSSRTIWLGQEFVDEQTSQHVRRVTLAAVIMVVLQVTAVFVGAAQHHFGPHALKTAFLNLCLGLALPMCGLIGATRSNSQAMCCFWGTNILFAVCQLGLLVMIAAAMLHTDLAVQANCDATCRVLGCGQLGKSCSCHPDCLHYHEDSNRFCCRDYVKVCPLRKAQISCGDLEAALGLSTVVVTTLLFIFLAPGIGLSTYASYHGVLLWRRLSAGEHLVAGGALTLSRAACESNFERNARLRDGTDAAE